MDNGKVEEPKNAPEEIKEEPLNPARWTLEPSGTVTIQLELNKLKMATALGFLFMMLDIIKDIYAQNDKRRNNMAKKIIVPGQDGMLGKMKNFLKSN